MSKIATVPDGFIEELTTLLTPWGMPPIMARVYAYLLLLAEPVSLDHIAEELQASKSHVSVAARDLVHLKMARRHGAPGTKRVFYGPADAHGGFLAEQSALLGAVAALLRRSAAAGASPEAVQRLRRMADIYQSIHQAIDARLRPSPGADI